MPRLFFLHRFWVFHLEMSAANGFPDNYSEPAGENRIFAAVLLFSLFLALPLTWGKLWVAGIPLFGEVSGTDFSVAALLALGVAASGWSGLRRLAEGDAGCRIFIFAAGFGGLLVCLQQTVFGWNAGLFLSSLFYFSAPVAGLLLAREIRRLLPVFLLILFLGSLGISLREWSAGRPALGLAGNWNWNWTLLAISAPSLSFFFPVRFRLAAGVLLVSGVAFGQFAIAPDHTSRGTLIGCIGAAILLTGAALLRRRRTLRRGFVAAALLIAVIAGALLYFDLRDGSLSARIPRENRLMLWQGAIALGETHGVLGVEPGRFEGEIASRLPPAYFDSDFAADRHPHPHNELLYLWCGFGIFGVAWWGIATAAGIRGMLRRRRGDERVLLVAWGWAVLLIHSQVDVILSTPLAGGLFALLTGTLAAVGIPRIRSAAGFRGRRIAVAAVFGGLAVLMLVLNLLSGWNCREGKLALLHRNFESARRRLVRSTEILPTPENLYTLGSVELFDFRNPEAAANAFGRIASECRMPARSHSAGRIARSLAAAGKLRESLPYFEQEQRNFPRSAVNLRLWESVLRALGGREQADRLLLEWRNLLSRKGIKESLFPFLMRNQQLDDSPLELKSFLRENGYQ